MRAIRRARLAAALALLATLAAEPFVHAQDKLLTLEDIFSPDDAVRRNFGRSPMTGFTWLDGDHFLVPAREDDDEAPPLSRVSVKTGKSAPFFDVAKMEAAFAALPGFDARAAAEIPRGDTTWSADHATALVNHADDLFLYTPASGKAVRLTHGPEPEVGEELSPDGRFVSFIRDYDLHLVEVASQRERALTRDGGPELFYGRLDWVYQEELYGRGNFKGYWWSPDSSRIAYLKLDESPVREFTVVDHLPTRLATEVTNYPKAGDPNPLVELGVVAAAGGETRWIDNAKYQPLEHLIVRVGWTPDGGRVVFQVQDREQTWLDLNTADPATGEMTTLFRETTPAWVEVLAEPLWLDDGGFLWQSERSGFRHVYRYGADGALAGAVTSGDWEVRELHGVDEASATVYFSGTERSPIELHVYRVGLDGAGLERLSGAAGRHEAIFAPDFAHYLDTWSDVATPPRVSLHAGDGKLVRAVDANPAPELAEYRLGAVELLRVPARDGFEMEAMLIKPPDFDPAKKYPVLQFNYGGPQAPVVRNAWGGARHLWHQMLAQKGYVVWKCDNRSAAGKGVKHAWGAYRRLGEIELRDLEDGLAWLRAQPWVDAGRLGVWGWSYGGFMAAYALTHSTAFKAGIAGAPVTDWRLYDSIYTERYMRRPQNNPEGYDATSVVKAAADLHGKLLLLHGTMDDNVHLQNTLQLVYELQKAGKPFELMLYPKSRHGVRDPEQVYDLYRRMTDFVLENL